MKSPPPVFTGSGFRREDNGWARTPAERRGRMGMRMGIIVGSLLHDKILQELAKCAMRSE